MWIEYDASKGVLKLQLCSREKRHVVRAIARWCRIWDHAGCLGHNPCGPLGETLSEPPQAALVKGMCMGWGWWDLWDLT